jgi:hypothetical protein
MAPWLAWVLNVLSLPITAYQVRVGAALVMLEVFDTLTAL